MEMLKSNPNFEFDGVSEGFMETINIDGKMYEYYEFTNDVEIFDTLFNLNLFLSNIDNDIELKNVLYQLVIYKENEIQAFTTKINSRYLLGISEGTFRELRNWFKMYLAIDKTYDVFGLKKENKDFYFSYTYQKALEFLIVHEYVHMIDGHCDIPRNKSKFICEQSKEISREEGLFSQILEYDADNWAAAYLFKKIVKQNISDEEEIEMLKLFVFAIYTVFRKFSDTRKYGFDEFMKDDLLKSTHPVAEIRYRYIIGTILANLPDWSQERQDKLAEELIKAFMSFESEILGYKEVKQKLFRLAHTLKGTKHLALLHNNWNKVATVLEAYTHVELNRVIPMGKEVEALVLIGDDGEIA